MFEAQYRNTNLLGRFCRTLLPIISALLVLPVSDAQAAPTGESDAEVWVDGPLDLKPGNDPRRPDAAVNHAGRKIFVWGSNGGVTGQDIFLRLFDPNGSPLGDPAQVNSYSDATQDFPHVAVAADNSFLVIWQSGEPPAANPDIERDMVRSQAYDADGQKVGTEQLLSTLETLGTTDISAKVAALAGGGYVAVWQSRNTATPGFNNITIQARLINANGTPNGDQYQVNSLNTGSVVDCDVAPLLDGGFVVVWTNPEIHMRRFEADGDPVAPEIQVNTIDVNSPRDESVVAVSEDGRVLVVWTDPEGTDTIPGTKIEIRGRLFSSTLEPQGADFRINSELNGDQDWPDVAPYGDDFFVVWQSESSIGEDNEPDSIEGRVLSGANQFDGSQFLVNQYVLDGQSFPSIGGAGQRVAITWRSQSNDETSQNVIQGLGWSVCGIFCDSFE